MEDNIFESNSPKRRFKRMQPLKLNEEKIWKGNKENSCSPLKENKDNAVSVIPNSPDMFDTIRTDNPLTNRGVQTKQSLSKNSPRNKMDESFKQGSWKTKINNKKERTLLDMLGLPAKTNKPVFETVAKEKNKVVQFDETMVIDLDPLTQRKKRGMDDTYCPQPNISGITVATEKKTRFDETYCPQSTSNEDAELAKRKLVNNATLRLINLTSLLRAEDTEPVMVQCM